MVGIEKREMQSIGDEPAHGGLPVPIKPINARLWIWRWPSMGLKYLIPATAHLVSPKEVARVMLCEASERWL